MAATLSLFANGRKKMWDGSIDLDTDTLKIALTTSSFTANLDTMDFFDDVTNEVTGTGYTAGGATLGSKTLTVTAADSYPTAWAASTAYAVGDIVHPLVTNGHLYIVTVAGTSGSSAPSWPTVHRAGVTDNTCQWAEFGTNIVAFDAADAAWTSSTITARYGVLYKSTGTASTSALIGIFDFGGNISSTSGTFTIQFHSSGIFYC